MQTVIVINLASYVVWAWDKAFALLFTTSANLSICVLKAVIYLYIKTQHSRANGAMITQLNGGLPRPSEHNPMHTQQGQGSSSSSVEISNSAAVLSFGGMGSAEDSYSPSNRSTIA